MEGDKVPLRMFLSTSSFWLGRSFKNLSKSSFDLRNWSIVVDAHQEDVAHVFSDQET